MKRDKLIIAKQKELIESYIELKSLYEFRTPPELGIILRQIIQKKGDELSQLESMPEKGEKPISDIELIVPSEEDTRLWVIRSLEQLRSLSYGDVAQRAVKWAISEIKKHNQ